jgi:cobalamin-dependent methionine synthase I
VFLTLRQQAKRQKEPNIALSDFSSKDSGKTDYMGAFV